MVSIEESPRQIILMGVSGSGKTTIGRQLSARLGIPFFDGDDFHSPDNVARMRTGEPLSDTDRLPWLNALRAHLLAMNSEGRSSVLACSALKYAYRQLLSVQGVLFVYLEGDMTLIAERLAERTGHYMPVSLLKSQFDTLEPPRMHENAFRIGVDKAPEAIVAELLRRLS